MGLPTARLSGQLARSPEHFPGEVPGADKDEFAFRHVEDVEQAKFQHVNISESGTDYFFQGSRYGTPSKI